MLNVVIKLVRNFGNLCRVETHIFRVIKSGSLIAVLAPQGGIES